MFISNVKDVSRRLDSIEKHIIKTDDKMEEKYKEDHEILLVMTKNVTAFENHMARDEEADKERLVEYQKITKLVEEMSVNLAAYKLDTTKEHNAHTNELMSHIRSTYETKENVRHIETTLIEKIERSEKNIIIRINLMWGKAVLAVSAMIITASLLGWTYVNLIKHENTNKKINYAIFDSFKSTTNSID